MQGEHNADILGELGYDAEIDLLTASRESTTRGE
jgi:hypothetical protein